MTRQMEAGAKRPVAGARQTAEGTAWENPLIPHARLRQIYRSMVRARLLACALAPAKRGRAGGPGARASDAKATGTFGLEAALVSPAVGLGPGDLVSDALTGGVVEFLRGAALGDALRWGTAERLRKSGRAVRAAARETAECGAAARLCGAPGGAERIWAALGAAAALQAAAAQATAEAKAAAKVQTGSSDVAQDGRPSRQAGVVMVYVLPGELTAAQWRKALRFAAEKELPVVFVALPAARTRGVGRAARMGGLSAPVQGRSVPTIAVDADDAVALYRVAQESVGRARIGGGAALIECVPFVPHGAAGSGKAREDAIAGLERYMAQRGVAITAWMEREEKTFAKRLPRSC